MYVYVRRDDSMKFSVLVWWEFSLKVDSNFGR